MKLIQQKLEAMLLLCGENSIILTSTVFDLSTRATDRQTDGETYGRQNIARSAYAVAR